MSDKVPMTKEGHAKLKKEIDHLKAVERPKIINAISEARELGDLSENAEYHAAKEKQSFLEGRILMVGDALARAEVVDTSKLSNEKVVFGVSVDLVDTENDSKKTYRLVGVDEANIDEGKISITSPIARGLVGKVEGDVATIKVPSGIKEYEIERIYFV